MPTMYTAHSSSPGEVAAYIGAALGVNCDSVTTLALSLSNKLAIRSTTERLLALGIVSDVVQQVMTTNGLSIDGAALTLSTIFIGCDGELSVNRELYPNEYEFRLGRNK